MDQQQVSGPPVAWLTTDMLSERDMLSLLQWEGIRMPKNESPITQHTPNVSFKHAGSATPHKKEWLTEKDLQQPGEEDLRYVQ